MEIFKQPDKVVPSAGASSSPFHDELFKYMASSNLNSTRGSLKPDDSAVHHVPDRPVKIDTSAPVIEAQPRPHK
ncbi:MAG TPA: hypothetical protein V6C69_00840 [Trichormus sp.]|jgi:hypothetical protein